MFLNHSLRRHLLLLSWLAIAGLPTDSSAQSRVFAKVDPNKNVVSASGELYDPASQNTAATAGSMIMGRMKHTATKLANGAVLIAGGRDHVDTTSAAEIFDPTTGTFARTVTIDAATSEAVNSFMIDRREGHTATLLSDGMVLIVGGYNGSYLASAELYDPATSKFSITPGHLNNARAYHTATLLSDGTVLIAGGYTGGEYLQTAEIYNPNTRTFSLTGSNLIGARAFHSATLTGNGEVLLAGGYNGSYLNTAVLYSTTNKTFRSPAGSMSAGRSNHTATQLSDGKVLITGGTNGNPLASAEIYDPSTGAFAATSNAMTAARDGHTATLLPNGQVLIAGGFSTKQLNTTEIYDPSSRAFTAGRNLLLSPRQNHTATLLANGKVLLLGGQNAKVFSFDINLDANDNVSPNIVFSADSRRGFVSCPGSGSVLVFSTTTGDLLKSIETGGRPNFITPLADGRTLAVVSAWEERVFLIDMNSATLVSTLSFSGATFGFGSMIKLSQGGTQGYISSTGTGEVIKFSLPDGKELGRLVGLKTPAQITLAPDDSTMIVVDTQSAQLIFANASTMKQTRVLNAADKDPSAAFSAFNSLVLSRDGGSGIIASRGLNANGKYTAFIFKTSSGEILTTVSANSPPGYTALTPDGNYWVILGQSSLLVVPIADPSSFRELTSDGEPLLSANLIFSPDSKYAYYASATSDLFVQQNLSSSAIVGSLQVGDNPDSRQDQASSVAITPDGKTFAVLDFNTNNIELISGVTVLGGTKFLSNANQSTGITLVNLSDQPANIEISALENWGSPVSVAGVNNPAKITLMPNGQLAATVDELFSFDGVIERTGWLHIQSDQTAMVGYVAIAKIKASWLNAYISRLDLVPLVREPAYDFLVPELSRRDGDSIEFNFLNPFYNQATYDFARYAPDGGVIASSTGNSSTSRTRTTQLFSAIYPQSQLNRMLIVGGADASSILNTAEVYDPAGTSFTATAGTLNSTAKERTATLLSSGKVLIAGGKDASNNILNKAELYDPSAGTFTATSGAMNFARFRGSATLLSDGRVLIAGGQTATVDTSTAEIYNPATDSFGMTPGAMTSPRDSHTATLLQNGKILIAGGSDGDHILDTAELYDPASGTFAPTGKMSSSRAFHTATLLPDGRVLIAGGYNGTYVNSADIYDPATGRFASASSAMTGSRAYHTATLLPNKLVLLAGGRNSTGVTSTAELYNPATNSFRSTAGNMSKSREYHTATLLATKSVLILGGSDGTTSLKSAEIYNPDPETFTESSNAPVSARQNHTATLLNGGIDGYMRIATTEGLMFSEYYGSASSSAALAAIDVDQFSGINRLYSPQIAIGGGFKTNLNLINGNKNAAELKISLHGPNGTLVGQPVTLTLEPGAQLKGDLATIANIDSSRQSVVGWLEIGSSVDLVVGTGTFTDENESFLSSFQLEGTPMSDFIFPMAAQDSVFLTAIALLNAGRDTAAIRIELWGAEGSLMRSQTLQIAGGSRTALYLSQYFPNLGATTVANVRIHSDRPIFGLGVIHDQDVHFMTALPPVAFPPGK